MNQSMPASLGPDFTQQMEHEMSVYKAINKVQRALSKTGISKDKTNHQGSGYKFRGIDDVFNALSPLLAEFGLCILPRMIERSCEERTSKSGGALFYVTVKAEFDFVCADDGSKHTVSTFGEAMDSGDKATNKAMSAAYKYAAIQAFAIPTEGDNDADSHTHEVSLSPVREALKDAELTEARKNEIENMALIAIDQFKRGDEKGPLEIAAEIVSNDDKLYFWHLLRAESKLRSFIKANLK